MIAQSSIITILLIAGSVVIAEEKVCSSFCSSLGMLQSSPGKSCAEIYQINKASRGVSGLYWIKTGNNSLHQVNCDMELECGGHKGGWTTITKFDMSKGDSCPSNWIKINTPGASSKVVCRAPHNYAYCYSIIFPTYNITFNKVCGQVKGYQKGNCYGFYSTSIHRTKAINSFYTDGVSITMGHPHKHLWTYAAGFSDDHNNDQYTCPCAATPGPNPPSFVGDHYYCESGTTGIPSHLEHYTSDVLWDGLGCHHNKNNCCNNPGMPWFFRQLPSSTREQIEARLCVGSDFAHGSVLVESIELYIQ